jgi:hypothetical protein
MLPPTSSFLDAFLVSVNYTDLLALTLPHNRRHFRNIFIVTSLDDYPTVLPVANANNAMLFGTDAFYRRGAKFNKWLALEEGIASFRRTNELGWVCLMDADIVWPQWTDLHHYSLRPGFLYTPRRRICNPIPPCVQPTSDGPGILPPENEWDNWPLHRQEIEFAGYSQIFHANDPVLGPPPWHQTDWSHAGGADSFFQKKWPAERKIRPIFQVLHLGPPGVNWMGRSSPLLDGTNPPDSHAKEIDLSKMWAARRKARGLGLDPFAGERLP